MRVAVAVSIWAKRAWDGLLVPLAKQAGDAIMPIYGTTDFETKGDDSPLTAADLAANKVIEAKLARATPSIPVVSEEGSHELSDLCWIVDPLDGTKEFIKRNGEFTVNIALVRDGEPVAGVVHAPARMETWFGQGDQAFHEDRHGTRRPIAVVVPHDPLRVVVSRSHMDDTTKAFLDGLPDHRTVATGSSLKVCRVADGSADLYPRFGPTMCWDIAAADAVLRAAGGACHGPDGLLTYRELRNPPFIAAHPATESYLENAWN